MVNSKELELIVCIADGLTTKAMAAWMETTESDIMWTRKKLFQRFELHNSPHLISWAYQNKILKIEK